MDSILMYAITLFTLPAVSVLMIILIHKRSKRSFDCPPGSFGLPLLGENISFALSGLEKFISDRMKKYSSDVFMTSLFGEKMAILCGPQGNKFIFSIETSWWPQSLNKIFYPPGFVQDSVMGMQRIFIHDFLKPEALKQYIPIMDLMAQEHIDKEWAPHQEVKVFPLSRKYTFDIACRLFLNVVDSALIKKLSDPYHLMTEGLFSLPIDLPGTAYNRAIKAGNTVRQELFEIIRDRRKDALTANENEDFHHQENGNRDLLSRLILENKENGERLSVIEISNIIIGLLVASYETTSNAVTFLLKHLAEYPHIYKQVLREQDEIAKTKGPGDLLTWKDIEKMKYSWNVVRESLRMVSTSQGAFRKITTDCTYGGFAIPKGWKIFWSAHTTHKNPKYFIDPEKFDPTRFEGSGPSPYTYVPFGGGPRICSGKEYAKLEILVFMHNIVRRFKLELTMPNERILFQSFLVPEKGLPVRLHPIGIQSVHEP